jgi:putative ABC transport system permease protein
LGAVGTILGSILGVFGAFILTRATSQVLQSDMPDPQLQPLPFLISAVFGIGIAWLGAYMPARRAGLLPPSEAMQSSISSEISGSSFGWRIFGGILSSAGIAMHLGCILGWLSMKWSIPGSALFLFGMVFLIPMLFPPMSVVVQWMLAPFMGVESKLAYRQLMRHRSRTALTTSVLFIAISSGLGLGCTIMDNIRDVDVWCSQAIVGDIFVRAAMPDLSTGRSADLPDDVGEELKKVPGIKELEPLRFVNARSGDNSLIVIIRAFRNVKHINFDIMDGTERSIMDGFNKDQIVIGSVLAERTKLKLGDKIPMQTLQGTREFLIAGVVNDYIAGGLTIYMDRKLAEKVFEVQGQDAYIIQAEEGKLAEVEKAVSKICDEQGLLFQSNADLVEMIRAMSRGVNASLWGLLALGSAIASFGLINTLSMNIIEQTREIGLLRVVAMTRKQIRRMIFAQALLLGIVGFVPGACMGFVVAYLINLSTYTATGHVIEFVFRPWLAIAAVAVSLAMALAASLVPAERAARISLPTALRYE